jgi:hypothetical protein
MNRSIPTSILNQHEERLDFRYHPGDATNSLLVVLGHATMMARCVTEWIENTVAHNRS